MRKFGLIAAIGDFWARLSGSPRETPLPKVSTVPGTETARLLDNFEQRFAELKGRKPTANVLGDLYTLGNQLEQRNRIHQATAVYRHLARHDNGYRDVATRLKRLMDAERASPRPDLETRQLAAKPAPTASPGAPRSPPAASSASSASAPPAVKPARPAGTPSPASQAPSVPSPAVAAPSATPTGAPAAGGAHPERLGRYQLEREIGRGAMGIVYLGRDTAINRMVAIKAIPLVAE